MDKQATTQLIKEMSIKPKVPNSSDAKLVEIEKVIKNYLAEYPKDTDMWLRLTMLEHNPPWEDPYRIVSYLNNILSYDPHNIQAVLILAYMEDFFFGKMKESTFEALHYLQTNDPETLSMIEYAKAFYYLEKDQDKYEQHLIKSVQYWDKHVNYCERLGSIYLKKGALEKGRNLIQKALKNIQEIFDENSMVIDITDIDEFFNYYYKGTHTLSWRKEDLEELLIPSNY